MPLYGYVIKTSHIRNLLTQKGKVPSTTCGVLILYTVVRGVHCEGGFRGSQKRYDVGVAWGVALPKTPLQHIYEQTKTPHTIEYHPLKSKLGTLNTVYLLYIVYHVGILSIVCILLYKVYFY